MKARASVLAALLVATPAAVVQAQHSCFLPRPAPQCSVFFITNAGGYIKPVGGDASSPFRVMVDWGIMANTTPRHAIGASWFVTLDEDELTTGPVIRYRRWFDGRRSLDVALGTPIAGGSGDVRTGSMLGMVKYNPVPWFGVAIRPEYLRRRTFNCSPGPGCTQYTTTSARLYGGVEVGQYPGLALSLAGLATLGFLAIVLAGVD
jgi:hypothetical protein